VGYEGGKNIGESDIMAALFLEGIASTSMALRLQMYAMNMYCMDLKEWTGNMPGRLVYIVPVLRLARVAKQNISWAAQISLSGCRLWTSRWAWTMAGCMVRVD
jgi:hypothetical protein